MNVRLALAWIAGSSARIRASIGCGQPGEPGAGRSILTRRPAGPCGSRRLVLAGLLFFASAAQAEYYTVPLLVPAGTSGGPQGVVRILNGTDESGTVEIYAINDAGTRFGPATFTLNASAAVQFTATDLASGNATLGLTGGIGTNVGDARLQIETDLSIVPLAFVRAADGTLSAMHDTVRGASVGGSDGYTYEVPIFNPASEVTQLSRLRLINPGDAAAAVTIVGRDDSGAVATGGDVTLMLAAGGAQTLTAQQLEAGDTAITGRLSAGTGKWRLTVSSDQPLQVVNIVAATAGYWNNLSTTAVPGAAPADLESLNERFVGNAVVYITGSSRFTLNAQTGERFTETEEIDGVSTTYMGSYDYSAIGADAGRLTLTYDDGDVCAANLYFSTHTAGWFASHCTGSDYPADGTWSGGSWSVEDDEDDGGEVTDTLHGVDDALPGVPTSGLFIPSVTSGGSVTASGAGTTIELNDGGYFELSDGTRYTCTSVDGCAVENGTVTRGTVAGRAAGDGEVDQFPTFRTAVSPGDQTYTVGTAIDALTLPEASSGNAPLSYSLTPSVPGLTFDTTARQLTGTPSTTGTYAMTYTVTDEDGDTDALSFAVTVSGDDRASATQVEVGSDTPGALTAGDVDYFRVDVNAAGTLEVYSSGGVDTVGRLENATGSLIDENDDGGTGTNFRITADISGGTYYVRVRGYSSRTTGSYTLHVRFSEFAPADQTAFNAIVVGKRLASADPSYYTDFTSVGRFREVEPAATYTGSYTYEKTGVNSGRVVFNYDDGDRCTTLVTFASATTGTASYSCNDGSTGTSSWRLIDVPGQTPDTTTYERLDLIRVSAGRVQFSFFSAGGCITLGNTTINGVTYSIVSSKWQTRAGSGSTWSDVAGTERTGQLCSLNPSTSGQYRLVAEITINGTTGNYSSNILSI